MASICPLTFAKVGRLSTLILYATLARLVHNRPRIKRFVLCHAAKLTFSANTSFAFVSSPSPVSQAIW